MASTHIAHHLKVEAIEEKLAVLKTCKTADEVARVLKAHLIKGIRRNQTSCPVAIFLNEGGAVGAGSVVLKKADPDDFGPESIPLPSAVATFVRKFDAGDYPALSRPPR